MENNNTNGEIQHNKTSLQLRSKEVSEVMGHIPSWISGWGLFLILFLFAASMFLIANIHCVQTVNGTALLKSQQQIATTSSLQDVFIQVSIPAEQKVSLEQQVTLYLAQEKNSHRVNKINCSVSKIHTNKDSCVLFMTADKGELQQLTKSHPLLLATTINCGLALDITVFKKVVNSVF